MLDYSFKTAIGLALWRVLCGGSSGFGDQLAIAACVRGMDRVSNSSWSRPARCWAPRVPISRTSTCRCGCGSASSRCSPRCSPSTWCCTGATTRRRPRRALVESAAWVACGLAFAVVVLVAWGGQAFGEYISGYVIEKSLSIDNVFVWAIIFSTFAIPLRYQHRVLFWGIFGALTLRAVFILGGSALITRFWWMLPVFGADPDRVGRQGHPPPRRRGHPRPRPRGQAARSLHARARDAVRSTIRAARARQARSPPRCSPRSS